MATLQDVARRAGVSTATVSKVLSNTPYFTDATRDKVLRAVEELGYVPNLAARALSSGKTHIVAVVFPYVYDAIFKDPLIMHILEGIEAECTPQGYNILLSTPRLSHNDTGPHYKQLIKSGYIEGVIAIDNVVEASATDEVRKQGLPAVIIGYHEAAYSVRSDDFAGGQAIMQHVLEAGHHDIGIVSILPQVNFAIDARIDGMRLAVEAAGLNFGDLPTAYVDFSTQGGAAAAASLLAANPELTALVCINDRMAMGAVQEAQRQGRRVPYDLTVTGYDDIAMAAIFSPPLTTVSQNASEMGRVAARLLFEVLDNREPVPVVLSPELILRQSTAAPRFPNVPLAE